MITYSAPAKVILSGEHAVVYGKPALATAIDLRMYVSLWEEEEHLDEYTVQNRIQKKLTNHIPLQSLTEQIPSDAVTKVTSLVQSYLKKKKIPFKTDKFSYALLSQIPLGRGLGSSAALAVSVVAALLEWYTGKSQDQAIINTIAYNVEKHFHHNPSGIDNSVSCYGGLVYYRKEFEFLKQFSSLNFKLAKELEDRLFLIDSGKPTETTAEMVQRVGKTYNQHPEKMEAYFQSLEKMTKRVVIAIAQENMAFFTDAVGHIQTLLDNIGIVSPTARTLVDSLQPFGTGKVTGAGGKKKGSGFILFYAEKPEELKSYLYTHKIPYYKLNQDVHGVQKISV
jgi:mevalonate kinase